MDFASGFRRLSPIYGRRGTPLAAFLMIFCASCSQSIDPGKVAVAPQLPALPPTLAEPCEDPGIDRDALIALAQHRLAWADCRTRQKNLVQFYRELSEGLGNRAPVE